MVKQGYKQTEIGVIPEDWEAKRLSELFIIGHGKDQKGIETKTGKYPILATSGIIGYTNHYLWGKPSALIGRKGTINKPQYIETPFWTIDTLFYTKLFEAVCPKYVYYLFCTIDWLSFNEASGVPSLSANNIEKVVSAIPPFAEQKRISETLSDVDSMISSIEKLIAKKKAVKQGAMQELLTGKKRLPGYDDVWKKHKIGDYVNCYRGVSYSGNSDLFIAESNQTIRLLRSNNIQEAKFKKEDVQYIRRDIVADNQKLQKLDIMICMANGSKQLVGKNCIFTDAIDDKYTYGAFMSCLRANKADVNMFYIFALLNSSQYWNNIALLLSGSSINNLRPVDILEMEFNFPTIAEQNAIASILSNMDNEIEALEQKLAKTRQIKQGMMQQLLTGKIRLV